MSEGKYTLLINSTGLVHELALMEGLQITGEWNPEETQKGEEQWIEFLQRCLEEKGLNKKDLKAIHVIEGPGPFTSLRVGVAFANALAYGLDLEVFVSNTFELLEAKLRAAGVPAALCGLHAGGSEAAYPQNTAQGFELVSLDALLDFAKDQTLCFEGNARARQLLLEQRDARTARGDLNPQQILWPEELPSFAQICKGTYLQARSTPRVISRYLRGAHITVSKDPWKQSK